MRISIVRLAIVVAVWLSVPLLTVSAQEVPLPAQPPDDREEVTTDLRDAVFPGGDIPAREAEEWTPQTEIDFQTLQDAGISQSTRPIPIPDAYATTEGVTLEIPAPGLIANDYHPDGLSFILSNFFPPEHGTLPSIVTNGAFRYEPPPGFTGTDTFRYILRDADGVFSEAVTVTIEVFPDPNRNPIAVPDEFATLEDDTLDVPAPGLIENDIDPDGDTFILSNFFSPEHGTLPSIVTNGAFRYSPPSGFTGIDTFRYILRDSKGAFSDPDTVKIYVLPSGGDHPVAIPDHYVTMEGQTLDIPAPGLIANDIDLDGDTFILSNFFPPEHGTLPSIVTNGAFRYVPDPDFIGSDTFSYRLRNSKGNFSEFVTVTVEVLPDFNRPPVPIPDFYGVPADGTLDIPAPGLIANDFDPDGDSFILSQFFPPEHGSLPSIVTNGAFRYVPPPGFTGVDTFRYRLRDNNGKFSDFIDVTIFVGIETVEAPGVIALLNPEDGAADISILPKFSWEEDQWAETYRLQLASDEQFNSILINADGLQETSYLVNDLLDYLSEYYWRVRGANEIGEGDWSQVWSFTTQHVPVPENLLLTEVEDVIKLSWDISSTVDIDLFRIYRGPAVGQLSIYDTVGPDVLVYTDADLSRSTSIYAVTAVDKKELESFFSNIVSYYSVSLQVTELWNLISLPVEQSKLQLTNSQVIHFDHVYRADSLLVPQKGYWVRSEEVETVDVHGAGAASAALDLGQGWNLIGSLIDSVAVESISDPSEILTTAPVFGYDGNGYQEMSFITPGNGYWIHAGQPGTIELKIDSEPSAIDLLHQIADDKGQPPEERYLRIVFSLDKTEQIFFISEEQLNEQHKNRFLMPPKAPEPKLDVRSGDGYRIGDSFPVELNIVAYSYPVSVLLTDENNPAADKVFQLIASHRGGQEKITLLPGEEVLITREYESLVLHQLSDHEQESIVEETGIDPVYPNPFNVKTTICYRLSGQTNVRLEIYDIIGRRVAVLEDGVQASGVYIRRFDASQLASGLYFLRFQAGDVQNIQKLTLIK